MKKGLNINPLLQDQCKNLNKTIDEEYTKTIKGITIPIMLNDDITWQCKTPCVEIAAHAKLLTKKKLGPSEKNNRLRLLWGTKVKEIKTIVTFTGFDLIVDVGSALGLWLGLSAVSIADDIIDIFGIKKFRQLFN